jgi:hypothetical protein
MHNVFIQLKQNGGSTHHGVSVRHGRSHELLPLLRQHESQSIVDDTSTVIVKRLISGCGTTTSMMIAYTPCPTSAGGIVCGGLFS